LSVCLRFSAYVEVLSLCHSLAVELVQEMVHEIVHDHDLHNPPLPLASSAQVITGAEGRHSPRMSPGAEALRHEVSVVWEEEEDQQVGMEIEGGQDS
jgi:hypothetical protein